ncbi:hypothetical protein KIPB_004394, partial [Kipferlia bialata]
SLDCVLSTVKQPFSFDGSGFVALFILAAVCLSGTLFWTLKSYAKYNSRRRKDGKGPMLGLGPKRYQRMLQIVHSALSVACIAALIAWHKLI